MRHGYGRKRMDRVGSWQYAGIGKCAACKRDDHRHCTNRAEDNATGDPTICWCRTNDHGRRQP